MPFVLLHENLITFWSFIQTSHPVLKSIYVDSWFRYSLFSLAKIRSLCCAQRYSQNKCTHRYLLFSFHLNPVSKSSYADIFNNWLHILWRTASSVACPFRAVPFSFGRSLLQEKVEFHFVILSTENPRCLRSAKGREGRLVLTSHRVVNCDDQRGEGTGRFPYYW